MSIINVKDLDFGDGASQSTAPEVEHERLNKPIHEERKLKVICIGAAASGLLVAYKLQRSFTNFELTIYDKNDDIGGTWYENKYPGCACDVAAHTYTWSFEPNKDWSCVYAGSKEIYHYFKGLSKKHDLEKYCKLSHRVAKGVWNAEKGIWEVDVENLKDGTMIHDTCHMIINAGGLLNFWRLPNIEGIKDFKQPMLHTAHWDETIDLEGKHVGIIGNGSSAVQVLPAIAPKVSKITQFVRRPTWVLPVQPLDQHIYTEEERRTFQDPDALMKYRKELETAFSALWPLFYADSDVQKGTFSMLTGAMKDKLKNERLEKLLIPDWPIGCRRITPGVGYLEAVSSDKVEVVFGEVQKITETGVIGGDGVEHPLDVLICATGFDTSNRPQFPLIGLDGQDLNEVWAKESESYWGLATYDFPNYFMVGGPSTPVGNGPVLIALEAQIDYALKVMDRWQTENIHHFQPKREAVKEFGVHKDKFMEKTVWSRNCRSWYKNNSVTGKVTVLWPGSTLHYLEAMAEPRWDDWDIKYTGNRFAWLGNGYSQTEQDPAADWAYYLRNEDDSPFLSRGKRLRAMIYPKKSDKEETQANAVEAA